MKISSSRQIILTLIVFFLSDSIFAMTFSQEDLSKIWKKLDTLQGSQEKEFSSQDFYATKQGPILTLRFPNPPYGDTFETYINFSYVNKNGQQKSQFILISYGPRVNSHSCFQGQQQYESREEYERRLQEEMLKSVLNENNK